MKDSYYNNVIKLLYVVLTNVLIILKLFSLEKLEKYIWETNIFLLISNCCNV